MHVPDDSVVTRYHMTIFIVVFNDTLRIEDFKLPLSWSLWVSVDFFLFEEGFTKTFGHLVGNMSTMLVIDHLSSGFLFFEFLIAVIQISIIFFVWWL